MGNNFDINKVLKALDASRTQRALTSNQSPTAQNLNTAQYILSHANTDWNKVANTKLVAADRDSSGPSVISRIFDILSRPNYAVANFFNDALAPKGTQTEQPNLLDSLWQGFSGKDKTTFANVIETAYNRQPEISGSSVVNPVAKYGGGFLLDVALDPLSLIGPGALQKGARALGLTSRADKLAAVPSKAQNLAINELPKDLAANSGFGAKPVNPSLYYNSKQLPPISEPPPNILPLGGDIAKLPQKMADVDVPYIKTSPEYEQQIGKIDFTTKNMARQRFKTEAMGRLSEQFPELSKNEKVKKLNLWLMENFPVAGSQKYKEISEGVKGPEPLGKPPVAEDAIKPEVIYKNFPQMSATDIVNRIQQGDPAVIAEQQVSHTARDQILQALGPIRASENTRAIEITDRYIDNVVSQPNKFPKDPLKAPSPANPAQMANLATRLNNFVRMVGKKAPGKFNTFNMLRAAEERLIEKGFHPTFWDGSQIRPTDVLLQIAGSAEDLPQVMKNHLTQVITAFKNQDASKLTDPIVVQAIEELRAKSAITEAPKVSHVIDQASQYTPVAEQVLSQPKYNEFLKQVAKEAEISLNAVGSSQSAVKAARSAIDSVFTLNKTTPLQQTYIKRNYIQSYMQNGQRSAWFPVAKAQSKGIEDELGFKYSNLSSAIGDNKAVEGFMSRMATWWGQKDLRPDVLIQTQGAFAKIAARARVWNAIAKQYGPDEISEAFKVAQGRLPMGASTDRTNSLGGIFEKAVQNLLDSTGLTQEAVKASTVAMRSGMLLRDINKQLDIVKSPFRFEAARFSRDGVTTDLTNGTDWLKSWQFANVEKPLEFMYNLETAVEQVMAKYAFMDEIAARWGSNIRSAEFSTPIKFDVGTSAIRPQKYADGVTKVTKTGKEIKARERAAIVTRLDGLYFPKEIAPQIYKALSSWDQIYDPQSDLVKLFDKVTRFWKSGVTIYAPSHHIRNLIGDVFLSWMAGVNSPRSYTKAGRILYSQKKRYKDLESVEQLVGKNAVSVALTKPGDVITHTRYGKPLTAEQIYIGAHNNGVLPDINVIEDLFGDSLFKGRLGKPLGGRVGKAVRGVAENREHFTRLAHFVNYIEKSPEKDIAKLFKDAAKEVRKWHPDGSDLTDFERNVLRRIMPFYSWTRKAMPLMVESAITRPGRIVAPDKFAQALQGMMGIDAPSRDDPFPYDQLFPDWIKEKGIGPIAAHGMGGIPGFIASLSRSTPGYTGEPSGYTVVNPSNPFIDMVAQFAGMGNPSDPLKGVGQLAHPAFKIPFELIQGRTLNDVPIEPGRYLAENTPLLSMLERVTNVGLGGLTKRGQEEGFGNAEALLNLITALGIQGTGPYIKTAEFQERDRRRAANAQRKQQ